MKRSGMIALACACALMLQDASVVAYAGEPLYPAPFCLEDEVYGGAVTAASEGDGLFEESPVQNGVLSFGDRTSPDHDSFVVSENKVMKSGSTCGTISLRFYDDAPHVPFVGIRDFYAMVLPGGVMKVRRKEDGTYLLTSNTGTATADVGKDTLYSEDISAFTNLMGQVQEGMDNTYYDGAPFIRYAGKTVERKPEAVTFEFSKYDIDLRGDEDDVYFPLATLSDIYSDLSYHYVLYNGENVYLNDFRCGDDIIDQYPDYLEPLKARMKRDPDMAGFNYNELCFAIDHFYGFPGKARLNEEIAKKGLDRALYDEGGAGSYVGTALKSADMVKYMAGAMSINGFLYDMHTYVGFWSKYHLETYPDYETSLAEYRKSPAYMIYDEFAYKPSAERFSYRDGLREQRDRAYGKDTAYITKGDTAVIVYDSFEPDFDDWDDFYGSGHDPSTVSQDRLWGFVRSLDRAQKDPRIKNVVIDLTANGGGSLDYAMMISSLVTGESDVCTENVLTGEKCRSGYIADRNLDGKFDEEDDKVKYDLNFAVLTSDFSFSAATYLSSVLKDKGVLIMGEDTGGGACAIQQMAMADGNPYYMSSHRFRLLDGSGYCPDDGVKVHVNLVSENGAQKDCSAFYDIDRLSREINAYYAKNEEKDPGLSDPSSLLHRTTAQDVETVSVKNAKYSFSPSLNCVVIAGTREDVSPFFTGMPGYEPSAKHRYICKDKKTAKVSSKGILSAKTRGETDIECLQKVKGGTWQKVGDSVHIFIQMPRMQKASLTDDKETSLNAYHFLSKTTYSPTLWKSSNESVAKVDEEGNITILKTGKTKIIAQYGEGKNGTKKKYATNLKVVSSDKLGYEIIAFDKNWTYAANAKITDGKARLYRSGSAKKKNKVICINAGHGTKGGKDFKTLCHPDGSPKIVTGSTAAGATYATAISEGIIMKNGDREGLANLKAAMAVKQALLKEGYDVLMIREEDDVQFDNIARTLIANNCADMHIAIHYDSTATDKGVFYCSVPDEGGYREMEPVRSHWQEHEKLGKSLIGGLETAGFKAWHNGALDMDLTQTSYSTVPSVDLEIGDTASDYSDKTLKKVAQGVVTGINTFFE